MMVEGIPSDDRAFLYGDGVFETLLSVHGRVLWPELHLERLMRGADRLGIIADETHIKQRLAEHVRQDSRSLVLRLTLSRGSGPRGYTPPKPQAPRLVINAYPLARDPQEPLAPMRLGMSSVVMADQPLLAGIKHCNRLEQVLAAQEAAAQQVDDVLLTNTRGNIQCSSCCNVFAIIDGSLRTPECTHSGVAGTRQRVVVETLAPRLKIPVSTAPFTHDDLRRAETIFLSNAVLGLRGVKQLAGQDVKSSDTLLALQSAYYQEVRRCLLA